jgi:tetratricopeptide (TPR) repeat protein
LTKDKERFYTTLKIANNLFDKRDFSCIELFENLYEVAKKEGYNEEIVEILTRLSFMIAMKNDFKKLLTINLDLLSWAEQENNHPRIVYACVTLGSGYWKKRNFKKALFYLQKGEKIIEEYGDEKNDLAIFINLGLVYHDLKQIGKSLEYYGKAMTIAENKNNKYAIMKISLNIQSYYYESRNYLQMKEECLKTIALAEELNSGVHFFMAKNNLGAALLGLEKYEEGSKVFQEIVDSDLFDPIFPSSKVNALMNLGKSYTHTNKFDLGKKYLFEALKIAKKNSLDKEIILCKLNISDNLYIQKDYLTSEKILLKAIKIIEKNNFEELKTKAYARLAETYDRLENYKKSARLWEKSYDASVLQSQKQFSDKVAELQFQYEYENEKREKEILEAKNKELQKINDELIAAQSTIKNLERKETVAAMAITASHEINQPLMTIKANAEMIQIYHQNLDEKTMEKIKNIDEGIQKISKILNKFLSESKIEIDSYLENIPVLTFKKEDLD